MLRSVSVLSLVPHELRGRWGGVTVYFSVISVSPRVVRCYGLLHCYFQPPMSWRSRVLLSVLVLSLVIHVLEGATVFFRVISGHPSAGGWLRPVLVLSLHGHPRSGAWLRPVLVLSLVTHVLKAGYGLFRCYLWSPTCWRLATACFGVISGHPCVGAWLRSVLVLSLVTHVLDPGYGLFWCYLWSPTCWRLTI